MKKFTTYESWYKQVKTTAKQFGKIVKEEIDKILNNICSQKRKK